MPESSAAELVQSGRSVSQNPASLTIDGSVLWSVSGLSAAAIEGVCAALVLLKGTALFAGLFGLMAAGASSWIHEDPVRIPLLIFAAVGALANLYMVWNGWRLRRSPAAAWRVGPRTAQEKRRTRLVLAASTVTLLLLIGEIYGHHVLHAG